MHPSVIASAYDSLAETWLDSRFSRIDGIRQHEHALSFLEPREGGWALNVGCGCNTRFNALWRSCGLRIEGVDISPRMVALARAADPLAEIHLADVCSWRPPRTYRFISAWDSIWHVPLARQRGLMLELLDLLDPGGVMIFTAGGLAGPGEHTDATMGPAVYYGTLGVDGILEVIREARRVLRHFEFDQWPQPHLVVVAQRAA